MDNYKIERMEILLKAAYDLLKKQEDSNEVLDILSTTAIWDEAHCDGDCLLAEISEILGID